MTLCSLRRRKKDLARWPSLLVVAAFLSLLASTDARINDVRLAASRSGRLAAGTSSQYSSRHSAHQLRRQRPSPRCVLPSSPGDSEPLYTALRAFLLTAGLCAQPSAVTELSAGFCNWVYRVDLPAPTGSVVVKLFSPLAKLRLEPPLRGSGDELAGEAGLGPRLLFRSADGLVTTFVEGDTLSEVDMHAIASETPQLIAPRLAALHALPPPAAQAGGPPVLWRFIESMLEHTDSKALPPSVSFDRVCAEVARMRERCDVLQLPVVHGHGDLKPSNIMRRPPEATAHLLEHDVLLTAGRKAVDQICFIDFELSGLHYRG